MSYRENYEQCWDRLKVARRSGNLMLVRQAAYDLIHATGLVENAEEPIKTPCESTDGSDT